MKHFFLIFAWFLLTTGVVLVSAGSFITFRDMSRQKIALTVVAEHAESVVTQPNSFGNLLGEVKGVSTAIEADDGRAEIVANFLKRYSSPLQPYDYWGKKLVEIADKNNTDFRLLPAMAMQESNLCKKIPEGSHNCLGFGIHERGTLGFDSYEANFERAAKELKERYIDKGLDTPEKIMKKYTPSSNGSWAASVTQWMNEMRYDDRQRGLDNRKNAVHVLELSEENLNASASSKSSNVVK